MNPYTNELPNGEGYFWARPQLTKANAMRRRRFILRVLWVGEIGGVGEYWAIEFSGEISSQPKLLTEYADYEFSRIEEPQ